MAKIASCDDYSTSIQVPQLIRAPELIGGKPIMNGIRPIMHTGGFCVVFPFLSNGKKYAVRCWHAHLNDAQEKMKIISSYLSSRKLPYFANFKYVEDGIATAKGIMPMVIMDWVEALSFKDYLKKNLNDSIKLNDLADVFLSMAKCLHENNISHGDLQQGNIMIKSNGDIVLVDYDSMFVPGLEKYTCDIPGTPGYQHPMRFKTHLNMSPDADYFSELVIYLSIKALAKSPGLWDACNFENTDTLLFSKEDLESKGTSNIFNILSNIDIEIKNLVEILKRNLSETNLSMIKPYESGRCQSPVLLMSNYCTSCGYHFLNDGDRFCIKCGHGRI